jgi:hypothetical protein
MGTNPYDERDEQENNPTRSPRTQAEREELERLYPITRPGDVVIPGGSDRLDGGRLKSL